MTRRRSERLAVLAGVDGQVLAVHDCKVLRLSTNRVVPIEMRDLAAWATVKGGGTGLASEPEKRVAVVVHQSVELVQDSGLPQLMDQIRPQWQSKGLIERVRRLMDVDPSSACQRLLNAAITDLRES